MDSDKETAKWLLELDNFGKPPPPKNMLGDDGDEFMEKVCRFQNDLNHPYANKQRVQVTQKIADSNGTLGLDFKSYDSPKTARPAANNKAVISRPVVKFSTPTTPAALSPPAKIPEITAEVRRVNRPLACTNPWSPPASTSSAYSSYSSVDGKNGGHHRQASTENTLLDVGLRRSLAEFDESAYALETHESHMNGNSPSIEEASLNVSSRNVSPHVAKWYGDKNGTNGGLLSTNNHTSPSPTTHNGQAATRSVLRVNGVTQPIAPAYNQFTSDLRKSIPQIATNPQSKLTQHRLTRDIIIDRLPPTKSREHSLTTLSPSRQHQQRSPPNDRPRVIEFIPNDNDDDFTKLNEVVGLASPSYGVCAVCNESIKSRTQSVFAGGGAYHDHCFTCTVCARPLSRQRYFKAAHDNKLYCELDYSMTVPTSQVCAACDSPIVDMVIQAVGKTYHPQCFRCCRCQRSLDGIPFAVDNVHNTYCVEDYHLVFAKRCAKCTQPILPVDSGEDVYSVVCMGNDYHVECYQCEGCGLQLTDEPHSACYPIQEHLLCKSCHIHWSRTGGLSQPITDL